jgi:two-component system, NtrC family, sensor kinase
VGNALASGEAKAHRSSQLPQPGLRLQILLALAGLMLLAFVPLFFAVASLTRATILTTRERVARVVTRTMSEHVSDAVPGLADAPASATESLVRRILSQYVGTEGMDAACAFVRGGHRIACEGAPAAIAAMPSAGETLSDAAHVVHGSSPRTLQVVASGDRTAVVARVNVEGGSNGGAPLVRLVALYMSVFGLALLVFAYFALTRLIVRPIERLVAAANRVAGGARTLRVPTGGAHELAALSSSMQAMAEKLIAEEASLILKVEELTETTHRLTQTQAQLIRSERMASVGRLAAGLAHEIGNPIAALMGMQDLVLDGGLEADEERDFIRRMRDETKRIHSVVRDLLDFARPEGSPGAPDQPLAPAAVSAVFRDVTALVRPQKLLRSVAFESDADESLEVLLPAPRLKQVLLNMVLNAAAAMESAKRDRGRISMRASCVNGRRVRIEVEDDGPGVAAAVRDRLFEPFVTTKPVGEGTGLGLAVCRGLVESVGGEIGLDSSYTTGARFYVVLPSV